MKYDHYILDEQGRPKLEGDFEKWFNWMKHADDHALENRLSCCSVRTAFTGVDKNSRPGKPPALWESRVTGGPFHQEIILGSGSTEEIKSMHAKLVGKLKAACEGNGQHTPLEPLHHGT